MDGRASMRAVPVTLRFALALAVSSAVAACAATARAAPRTFVAFEYEVAPDTGGCPGVEEFRASVERQLGYDPFLPMADRRVAVRIARRETGFAGLIKWSDARGRWVGDRRLSSRSSECTEIAANVAFAVAVQIQLLAALAPEPEPSAPETAPGTSPPSTPTSEANATPAAPDANTKPGEKPSAAETPAVPSGRPGARRDRFIVSSGLGASLGLGLAPDMMGLGRLFLNGRIDWFSLELGIDGALPVTEQEPDGSGFKLNRFAGSAAACGHVQTFAGCLTGTIGRLGANGYGVDQPASQAGLFSQLGARIAATLDFGDRYFMTARAEGLVMPSTWSVTLNDRVVWTTPRVGGLIGLDFGVHFF